MQYGILKNNKSPKMKQMNLEIINYSQEIVHKKLEMYRIILQQQNNIQMKSHTIF